MGGELGKKRWWYYVGKGVGEKIRNEGQVIGIGL